MVRTSITLPDDIYEELKQYSDNLSGLLTEILTEYLRKQKIEKAMQSFGKWEERDSASVDIVNSMRIDRNYVENID
ncbi:protein of unknown function DUF217 [Candidatus Magnetoovum chiemensis]|nr:protein of unknown function DUF217 [Candidatus Magnetoovum chiemensis]